MKTVDTQVSVVPQASNSTFPSVCNLCHESGAPAVATTHKSHNVTRPSPYKYMGLPITISASFLLSTSSLLQLRPPEGLISSTPSSDTQPLTLDPTSIMSRHTPDQQAYYRHRTLPEPHMTYSVFPTDPAGYISSTTDSNGWREKREPFEELLPMRGEDRPQYLDSPTLAPIRNFRIAQDSRQSGTPPGYSDSERSIQTTPHIGRPEERPSDRPAATAHESRKSRRSEGGGSGNPTKPQKHHSFSVSDQNDIIGYVKARMSWRQISWEMKRDQDTIKNHWNKFLKRDPRAAGVHYDPDYRI